MMTLFKTEIRQLLPLGLLWVALDILYGVWWMFTKRVDESSQSELCADFCTTGMPTSTIMVLTAIMVLIGWNLFPRDHDDGTLEHLQSLAVTRTQIFLAKVFAGFALVAVVSAISSLLVTAFVAANPQTIHGQFYAGVEWHHWVRDTWFGAIIISHAVLLSSFRLVGLVLYAGYFALLAWLESELGDLGVWNPLNLLRIDFYGSELITNWTNFAIHSAIAVLSLWLGYMRWMKGDANPTFGRMRLDSPWLTVPTMAVLFLGIMGYLIQQSNVSVQARNQNAAIIATNHYQFVHEKIAAPYAEELAGEADSILLEMADYLNAEPPPRIQTDLTARTSHIAGLAVHNRIRMRLRRIANDKENRFVLAHETAHVFQTDITNRQLKKAGSSVNFFVEGMAQQAAFTVQPDDRRRQANWLVGAIAADRHQIKFTDLVDAKNFAERFDAELPYTLGDLWVNTMAEVCGDDSIGDFLRVIGSDDAVLSLGGVDFWRQHLQRLPCELEDINFRFRQRIETLANSDAANAIPSTQSVNVRADKNDPDVVWMDVVVNEPFPLDEDGVPTQGRDYFVRIRSGASLSAVIDNLIVGYPLSVDTPEKVSFRLARSNFTEKRFQYQLGYLAGFQFRSVFDEWQNARVP